MVLGLLQQVQRAEAEEPEYRHQRGDDGRPPDRGIEHRTARARTSRPVAPAHLPIRENREIMPRMKPPRSMTTQQVASALNVRPATVQLYARNGRIPFDLTPGGHRRYNLEEVRAALAQGTAAEGAGSRDAEASRPPGRRHQWFVDASELEAWAERRDAQAQFPGIIRTLVTGSTPALRQLDVRTGEGVQLPGWDAKVTAEVGNAWVPRGLSVWELGTNEAITSKANSDYATRTADPLGVNPAEAVFVFVTPRRWSRRDSWATTKRAEGVWKDVRAYDADTLEGWLEVTPAVHARVTRLVGRNPSDVSDIGSTWSSWAHRTAPALPPELLTGGRDHEVEQIHDWLHGPAETLAVQADSAEEALAFIAASLLQLPDGERHTIEARTLVVHAEGAWNELLARAADPLVLIPMFGEPSTVDANDAGHHVAIPVGKDAVVAGHTVALPRLRHAAAFAALTSVGLPEHQAGELATIARRSLKALQRRLAVAAVVAEPPWAQPEHAGDLLPAVLAGAWHEDADADRNVLSTLAQRPYEDIARSLTYWAMQSDPPVRRVGNTWFVVSKEDAWPLLARSLTSDHLRRFHNAALEVLATMDPALDLDPDRRWAAGLFGRTRPWSQRLTEGLADTVALLASRSGATDLPTGITGQEHADQLVRAVLTKANTDATGRLWMSLSSVLPLLAEASPEQFLDAVDEGLAGPSPVLASVFDPDAEQSPFGHPTHTGLLWALEGLAWSQEHLSAAAAALARLSAIDPGGRWTNRPSASLCRIFLPWHPQTTTPLDPRLIILDRLRRLTPEIAWTLLVALLPKHHDNTTPIHEPRWREWKPEDSPRVTIPEYRREIIAVVDRLLEDVGRDGARWSDLIKHVGGLPGEAHEAVIEQLTRVRPEELARDDRQAMVNVLRTTVARHRRFPNADWAMAKEQADRLHALLERFETPDVVDRVAWLFADRPQLPSPRGSDWQEEHAAIVEAQQDAVREVLATAGLDGIWQVAELCERPYTLGFALGSVGIADERRVLEHLIGTDERRRQLTRGFIAGQFQVAGWSWAEGQLRNGEDWDSQQRAEFLLCLPTESRTYDWAERLGDATDQVYWSNFRPFGLNEPATFVRAATKLVEHDRATHAVELLGIYIGDADDQLGRRQVDPQLVVTALQHASAASAVDSPMFAFYAASLLDYLTSQPRVDLSQLAQLEWRYLPLLEDRERQPRVLHEELARDPAFFAEIVSWVYRADSEPEEAQITDEERVRADLGDRLLRSWRTVPGLRDDGSVDPSELASWLSSARQLLAEQGRIRVGDIRIGRMLRYAPTDSEGSWPPLPVREAIEDTASRDLERGLEVEVYNSRGVTTRGLTDGGTQERELAQRYHRYARQAHTRWPRTASLLRRIAETFEADARREDREAELREDFRR